MLQLQRFAQAVRVRLPYEWPRSPDKVSKNFLALIAVAYCITYFFNSARPRVGAIYPLGWYGWADQGEYLKSIAAFAVGNLDAGQHHYPPLYALLAAPFYHVMPTHPNFVPDLMFFVFYIYALLKIASHFYGAVLAPAVIAVICIAAPLLTIDQWVIPWTTSLQAALFSALFLIFFRFERSRSAFILTSRGDHFAYGAFFLCYGALLPTRPLDFVVAFPLAVLLFAKVTLATMSAAPSSRRRKLIIVLIGLPVISGVPFVALYFGFNLIVFKNLFGGYANTISEFRYDFTTILEKAYSIFLDSGAMYGETRQALFEKIPLLGIASAICVITAIAYRDIRRWIIVIAAVHVLLYLPYGDLLPTGVFRYYNLHYFKWMYLWIFVIAIGQAMIWVRNFQKEAGWKPLAAAGALILIVGNVSLVPTQVTAIADVRDPEKNTLSVLMSQPRDVDFIDINGLSGGFTDFYFGNHLAVLDATQQVRRREFRLLPIPNGARLLFSRPSQISNLMLAPDPGVKVLAGGTSSVGQFRFAFACRIHRCVDASKS